MTLKLSYSILVDVPHVSCLPSLKTLHLDRVTYKNEESLQWLLSNCYVLEDLVVKLRKGDNVRKFVVIIPSLLSLTFNIYCPCGSDGYVIDTPLKYFKTTDFSKSSSCLIANMPKLEEAHIHVVGFHKSKKLLEPVTSVRRLSLRILNNSAEVITSSLQLTIFLGILKLFFVQGVYDDDIVFNELEHLTFCVRKTYWSKLLFWLLNASPKLRDLMFNVSLFDKLYINFGLIHYIVSSNSHVFFFFFIKSKEISPDGKDTLVCWKQLISVPQCLLSSLQTFKCSGYHVSVEGKDLATYILRNSCQLKTATISIGPGLDSQKKLEMETEMNFSSRGSPTCNLVFDETWTI